ncbi:hypothetical protein SRHO_G00123580 [Serrasalmus rhombeus]
MPVLHNAKCGRAAGKELRLPSAGIESVLVTLRHHRTPVYNHPYVRLDTEGRPTAEPSCNPLQTSCPCPSCHHLPWTSCPPYTDVLIEGFCTFL